MGTLGLGDLGTWGLGDLGLGTWGLGGLGFQFPLKEVSVRAKKSHGDFYGLRMHLLYAGVAFWCLRFN